ncbi:helix-turn-helix transcriptional regulator [Pelosinus propionicus]|uniref:Helix-turn-helix n=1 Tax=Pelosinus propionicus DSM 13327 TaxID=1123291 RepID=A0A1I4N359_9FIRM|nr:helix-turn-helix transcriptional regulator [Pelosinus propionicus]SFM09982.1 Helix-turn-helix [Pelosinus propionicus DSM 13327]
MLRRENLLNARKKVNKTQAQVALECCIDRTVYSRIETGVIKRVDYELAILIARAVKSTADHIFLPIDVHNIHNKNIVA